MQKRGSTGRKVFIDKEADYDCVLGKLESSLAKLTRKVQFPLHLQ